MIRQRCPDIFCEVTQSSEPLHRSIPLAKKWCSRAEWIRMETAPFSALTRDCGVLLGLGLAQCWRPCGWPLSRAPRALSLAISSMGLYHINRLPLPLQPQGLFYGCFLLKHFLVPQLVMMLVPGLIYLFTPKKKQWRAQVWAGGSFSFKHDTVFISWVPLGLNFLSFCTSLGTGATCLCLMSRTLAMR